MSRRKAIADNLEADFADALAFIDELAARAATSRRGSISEPPRTHSHRWVSGRPSSSQSSAGSPSETSRRSSTVALSRRSPTSSSPSTPGASDLCAQLTATGSCAVREPRRARGQERCTPGDARRECSPSNRHPRACGHHRQRGAEETQAMRSRTCSQRPPKSHMQSSPSSRCRRSRSASSSPRHAFRRGHFRRGVAGPPLRRHQLPVRGGAMIIAETRSSFPVELLDDHHQHRRRVE